MGEFVFVKSSYSTTAGECVEVALNLPGTTAVRDSKTPARATLVVSATAWAAFTDDLTGPRPVTKR